MNIKLPSEVKTALQTLQALSEDIADIKVSLARLVELEELKLRK